jgi:hypothetical protein
MQPWVIVRRAAERRDEAISLYNDANDEIVSLRSQSRAIKLTYETLQ